MRTFVLGDIHGAHKALVQCLERSGFNKEVDKLIFLGDVADGWSEVPECVEELLSIKNLIALRGNHDQWAYEWLRYSIAPNLWLTQGGQATYDAYTMFHADLMLKHEKEYYSKLTYFYQDEDNRVFVHGGYTSNWGVGHEMNQATYYWDRTLVQMAHASVGRDQPRKLAAHKEVYVGHTGTNLIKGGGVVPLQLSNLWMMDTGAGWPGGKLTIMDIDTKEYFQSDYVNELYKDERGR